MNIGEIFIRRPVMTTLIMFGILLFGFMGYRRLPVSDLPNVDFPTVSVSASLPGASPETMASSVATPLERQFSTIAGIDSMTSVSQIGNTRITIQFALDRDLDAAAQDVQAAIARVQRRLPRDMPSPPTYQKVNPADQPILYIALNSPTLPMSTVNEYGETVLAQRISMVSGVAQVMVYGTKKYAVRIRLNPKALASRQIGIDQVASAVVGSNVNLPSGMLDGPNQTYTVQAKGQLTDASQYRPIIVEYRNGSPVRLDELGEVLDSVEDDKTAAFYVDSSGSHPAIILAVQRQPGTNTVQVATDIKKIFPSLKAFLPASVEMNTLYDRSLSIKDSVDDVKFTLLLTLFLVILVIFLFLRNINATIIPSLALPMSIVGTFAIMYLFNYSLDNLSLMALTLSIGFLVDDAIVMLENIVRHVEMGEGVFEAALKGSKEIGFTIVSMTLSLAAVFIPVLFMGGIVGRLFNEFAVTIVTAVLISGIVSLTLTPMLSSRWLKPIAHVPHGKWYNASENFFKGMLHVYDVSLKWTLNNRLKTLFFATIVLIIMGYLFVIIPKGFIPSQDTGMIIAYTQAVEGISSESMRKHQKQVDLIIQNNPNVDSFMSNSGGRGGFTGSNSGILFLRLKERSQRELSADQVIDQLRPAVSSIPGLRVFLQNPPLIRIGGSFTRALYQYSLQCPDFEPLYKYGPALEAKMKEIPIIQDVNSDLQIKNPQVDIKVDRDKASALGVSVFKVEDSLYYAYGQRQVSTIFTPTNEYSVLMELLPEYQRDPAALSLLYVSSVNNALVPLASLASIVPTVGPLSINHVGQLPSVTISFNTKPGVSLSEATAEVEKAARDILPLTIATSFQGAAQAFQSSVSDMGLLLIMAILVIYIILGILYESFIHPLTILSGLPSAAFGALVTLLIFKVELNLFSFIGIIMLIGIVKKNAIMMIDFALDAQRKQHKPAQEAIYQACLIRFRPIMMTTMAALMGALPIAIGIGTGAELRQPLGLAVVGGLLFSQLVTLFITPVIYVYFDALLARFRE
ncbi:MAG: acriflavine resistance protein B [Candidatus Fischerbacteria bacterium RBG_13_37_8]|uniref:Acriflavine resistance protein B n=1 Tax=Candidatus Fischerbacteria bacterium RBG_13_37_8 TaxID=1817863 RepID=A0A1F5VRR5_9BACT|nr:MAG: acriflavine resistance protein B [Candidatus Fischerbacteria bacterium RBG_13_37_8]